MDFANRGTSPVGQENATPSIQSTGPVRKGTKVNESKMLKIMTVVLLFAGTLVTVALIVLLVFGRSNTEASYIKKTEYQAVFLNGGQVYFGKIGKYSDKYLTLSDIFYLRVNSSNTAATTTSADNVSLAKLGNELHGPEDAMVINRSEVQFWENLKDSGQVVKAITAYKKDPTAATSTTNTTAPAPATTTPTTKK